MLRGHLETLVLSVLEQGDAHGYGILQRLKERGSGALNMKEGTLYPVLYRLEEAAYIQGKWEEQSSRRGPRRRIYRLTAKGTKHLAAQRSQWRTFVNVIGGIVEAT